MIVLFCISQRRDNDYVSSLCGMMVHVEKYTDPDMVTDQRCIFNTNTIVAIEILRTNVF